MDARSAQFAPRSPGAPTALRWRQDDAWIAVAGPVLIFAGHIFYGAMLPETALVLTAIAAALVGVCLLRPKLRRDLLRLDGLLLPTALFAAVICVAVWSLTPWVPGGPHPVWAYLHISPGAATIDKSATLLETIKLLGLACFFVLGLASGAMDRRGRLGINTILALAAALGAWALVQFVTGDHASGARLQATFLSANTAGTIFAVSCVMAMGPLVQRLTEPRRPDLPRAAPFAAAALLFLACLFATASRGAFMAVVAGLLVLGLLFVFSGKLKLSRAILVGGVGGLVLIILLGAAGEFLVERLMHAPPEFNSRSFTYQVHWQAFLDSPLFGYGLGTFDTVNRMLLNTATVGRLWDVRAAHSLYLGWLEEAGLVGALPMFGCIGVAIVVTVRKSLSRSRMVPIIFALVGVDVVYMAHGAVDFALQMFSVAAMWAYLLGLQFSLAQGSSRQ